MTAPSLGRLLISHITLRGPELAQLYAAVEQRPGASYDDLLALLTPIGVGASELALDEAPLREALNFLLVAGLVEQRGASRRRANFAPSPLLPGTPFPLLLLHHMHAHADERQRAPVLMLRQLVADDTLAISPGELREYMERGPLRGLFTWTGEKIGLWAHLMSYLGLVRRGEREAALLIVPQPLMLLAALSWAQARSANTSADRLLGEIDTTLFACFTAKGRVYRGLAQALLALERRGQIRLTHSTDAARSLTLGERRVSDIAILF